MPRPRSGSPRPLRLLLLALVTALHAALVGGCVSEEPIPRRVPLEITADMDTGRYELVEGPVAGPAPALVPVVTLYEGQRLEGLRFIPGTVGFSRLVTAIPNRGEIGYRVILPTLVEPVSDGWRLRSGSFLMRADAVDHSDTEPLECKAAVDPPGPAGPGPSVQPEGVQYEL